MWHPIFLVPPSYWCPEIGHYKSPARALFCRRKGPKEKTMKFALLLIATSVAWGQANPTPPVLPLSVPSSTRPTPTGSTVAVHSGDNLQAKYNAAACGQDLVLDDGAVFTGNFVFNKQCAAPNWILIEGTGCSAGTVSAPTYVTPSSINSTSVPPIAPPTLTHYATFTSTNGAPPLVTTSASNVPGTYNYVGCVEVTSTQSQTYLVGLTNALSENVASQFGDHLMFDRLYVHGVPASSTVQTGRGFLLTGSNISVVNSYVSQIYSGSDSQAILGAYGPGPYLIQNNFLSANTEVVMFGGTGKTPGYSCTIASSPSPTTTTATVNTCLDAAGGSVATPVAGTCAMFYSGGGYTPANWVCITANNSGALTWSPALPSAPDTGAGKIKYGMVPADITITKNYLYKLPSWNPNDPSYDGIARSSKNFIEDKYGVRWNITANAMVNTWNNGQNFAFNINVNDQNGDCPWCTSSDVTLSNNVVKNIAGGFVIISSQSYHPGVCPGPLKRVLIQNNLFWPQGATPNIPGGGSVFELAGNTGCGLSGGGTDSLQIIHNHLLGPGINMQLASGLPYNFTNLVIRDNLTEFDQYRWTNQCLHTAPVGYDGNGCISADVSTGGKWTAANNAIVNSGAINGDQGQADSVLASRYGSAILSTLVDTTAGMNYAAVKFVNYSAINADYHNFALTAASPFHALASDGTDPGVNFAQLDAAMGASTGLTCDLNQDGVFNVLDVQLMANQVLGLTACTNDLDGSGSCTIIDVQRVVNAALGGSCLLGP